MAPTRKLLEWRLTRMRRNAVLIADALRYAQIGNVYHAEVDSKLSTFLYVGLELRKEYRNDMERALRAIEEHARSLVHKSIGDDSYPIDFFGDRQRHLFYKYVSHQTPLRLSTSFGFSTTALTFLGQRGVIYARISAGCESLPALFRLWEQLLVPIFLGVSNLT